MGVGVGMCTCMWAVMRALVHTHACDNSQDQCRLGSPCGVSEGPTLDTEVGLGKRKRAHPIAGSVWNAGGGAGAGEPEHFTQKPGQSPVRGQAGQDDSGSCPPAWSGLSASCSAPAWQPTPCNSDSGQQMARQPRIGEHGPLTSWGTQGIGSRTLF